MLHFKFRYFSQVLIPFFNFFSEQLAKPVASVHTVGKKNMLGFKIEGAVWVGWAVKAE